MVNFNLYTPNVAQDEKRIGQNSIKNVPKYLNSRDIVLTNRVVYMSVSEKYSVTRQWIYCPERPPKFNTFASIQHGPMLMIRVLLHSMELCFLTRCRDVCDPINVYILCDNSHCMSPDASLDVSKRSPLYPTVP